MIFSDCHFREVILLFHDCSVGCVQSIFSQHFAVVDLVGSLGAFKLRRIYFSPKLEMGLCAMHTTIELYL